MENSSTKIKVSICIPTRNRACFIGQTLESVISQATDDIEIIIVDGASTDNTAEVVQGYQQRFKRLVYYRGEENMGVDRDMAKTIELAHGDYCWLLSDDDLLKPNALKRILKEIETGYEIYLSNITVCDLYMQPIRERLWFFPYVKDRVFNLHNENELIEYCNRANSIGALFSYMSSIVLSRQEWLKTGYCYEFDRTAYALAASLFSFIARKCRLKYIRSSLVSWRSGNESFQNAGGLAKRLLLDFDAYLQIADKYLSDNHKVREAFLRVMMREHSWYTIIHGISFINNPQIEREFRSKLLKFGYSLGMVKACCCLGRHKNLVSIAVAIKRAIVRTRVYNMLAYEKNI